VFLALRYLLLIVGVGGYLPLLPFFSCIGSITVVRVGSVVAIVRGLGRRLSLEINYSLLLGLLISYPCKLSYKILLRKLIFTYIAYPEAVLVRVYFFKAI
jgi:hypothetical protein